MEGNGIITKEKGDFIWRQNHQHQDWFISFIIHISLITTFHLVYTRDLCDKQFLFFFLPLLLSFPSICQVTKDTLAAHARPPFMPLR